MTSDKADKDDFFIGWRGDLPARDKPVMAAALLMAFLIAPAFAIIMNASRPDPGDGNFRFDWGEQTLTGLMRADPYPTLYVTEGSATVPAGRTVLLSGDGKIGVQEAAAALDNRLVTAAGFMLARGDRQMLQVNPGDEAVVAANAAGLLPEAPADVDLGPMRLTGEICDGKCVGGAMRPGRGLAHKACANLCLSGGIPPVLVTAEPVEGGAFFLLGDPGGQAVGEGLYDLVGLPLAMDGRLIRRGDLLIFLTDLGTAEILP